MTRIEELQRGIEAEATADFTALFCDGDVVDSGGDVTKSPGSKRKKKRKRQDGAEEGKSEVLQDPLEVFGSDMMMMILSYLDAPSVALSLLVSRGWHGVASSDRLWSTKGAPDYWRNLDPYWKGTGPPMRRYFHPDGSQTADPGDQVWGGHECCYSIVTSFVGGGKIREHYVRINRWPQMSVFRKPDWSWEMSNHLYCYSSIPDADKEGGTGPRFPVLSMFF
ncbi:uncharacterized protein LOC117914899 isoform X2 [Vitis riparia]|uniref:uncharacterized protein LOC117914899 isoform X2 n=1 Tax=Vitis riparia TaxID=96939 RepID=UPI00155A701C|nr:uncharacterized protein LOC117914899 isoform X2 [Vitis riparia]